MLVENQMQPEGRAGSNSNLPFRGDGGNLESTQSVGRAAQIRNGKD